MNLQNILQNIVAAGGRPLLVGGWVRDKLLNLPSKDVDIEVYGMTADQLIPVLQKYGRVDAVGKSFGVLKLRVDGEEYDFALPRRENKQGQGHRGFMVEVDPNMTVEEACARRDFTINAICYDPLTDQYIDPMDGRADLDDGILDPCSEHFKEDPLRVLRGMQFAGRFDMIPSQTCVRMCREVRDEYATLPVERIWGEWQKWAEKSQSPSQGLWFLYRVGWLDLYPDLQKLVGCEQSPDWHPEGDVFDHTLYVCNEMANICDREGICGEDRAVLMMAALCHDLGKPDTMEVTDRIRTPKHAEVGVPISEKFLQSIGCFPRIIERVLPLVKEHLAHMNTHSARSVRRLSLRLYPATMRELTLLVEADCSGRPPIPKGLPPAMADLLQLAEKVAVVEDKPQPILLGRHLIHLGIQPGKQMGLILKDAFEAQLDGHFATVEEGIEWFKARESV